MDEKSELYFRKRESWFKELLYKLKILKPKYKELGKIKEIKYEDNKYENNRYIKYYC